MAMSHNARFGWIPDLPDFRDHKFQLPRGVMKLPTSVDLRPQCPPVYDQGNLGSCTANAIAGILEFSEIKQQHARHSSTPSRLFIYYNEREMEGSIPWDAGAYIRDGIKSVAKQGAPKEKLWPYKISRFARRPNKDAYYHARARQALEYQRLDGTSITDIRTCLAQGFPFVFGFTVYESFDEIGSSGSMLMPVRGEQILGGHAVVAVGYDDPRDVVIVRNSWGDGWGASGYFYMPYAYITNGDLCDDFWKITLVE